MTTIGDVAAWSRLEYVYRRYHLLYPGIFRRIDQRKPPTIHRLEALRAATGLSRRDLYALIGIDLDRLPLHSGLLHASRTRPIQSARSTTGVVSLPHRLKPVALPAFTMPLTDLVSDWRAQPESDCERWRREPPQPCLYVQVGLSDGMSYPEVAPGMMLQVVPHETAEIDDGRLYVFEHPYGYSVCRAAVEDDGTIVLLSSTYGLYPELRFPRRLVRVLGRARACCGRIDDIRTPSPIKEAHLRRIYRNEKSHPELVSPLTAAIRQNAVELIRVQRTRLGITYDELDTMTRRLHALADWRLGVGRTRVHDLIHSGSSVVERPAVVYALAACFALDFEDVLARLGIDVRETTKPPELLNPTNRGREPEQPLYEHPLAAEVLARWLEWPTILTLLGPDPRTSGLFYFNQSIHSIEPLIKPHAFLQIDSTQRTIAGTVDGRTVAELPEWVRPIYLLLTREGYLCGYCERDEKSVSLVAHPKAMDQRRHTFPLHDVDIVGRVTGVATLL